MRFFMAGILSLPLATIAAGTNPLPVLDPPYSELPPTFWEQHHTGIFVSGFVFPALAALILWRILKPRPQPSLPPGTVAREALARLQRQPEDGNTLGEISRALRRYISVAFQFPATGLTTAEFSGALASNAKIGAELAQAISGFLRECDERKFSPAGPAAPLNAANRALELVAFAEKAKRRQDAGATS